MAMRNGDASLHLAFEDVGNPSHHWRSSHVETTDKEEDTEECYTSNVGFACSGFHNGKANGGNCKSSRNEEAALLDPICEDRGGDSNQTAEKVRRSTHGLCTSCTIAQVVDNSWKCEIDTIGRDRGTEEEAATDVRLPVGECLTHIFPLKVTR